ncbi:MAG: EAL domain-containing protein [Pseudomonadota bacterium]|nr:EAL domain-containing protein [Pseudomonadota bacterium]
MSQAMTQSTRRNSAFAVAYLDLDGFKSVNDQFGHAVGDRLLQMVARGMAAMLREGDTLARIGGDEFVAVLLDVPDLASCEPLIQRLLKAAAEPVCIGERGITVSASLGLTMFPHDDGSAEQLLRHADQAMYQAKLRGKNRYQVFDTGQERSVRGRNEIVERIRLALERQEFVLHYQPKVNLRTGAVVGVEALIRWDSPERGLLPPATFLPVLEDDPLTIKLGEWVLHTALTQLALWKSQGIHLPISVNVGARQLNEVDFMPRLIEILDRHPDCAPGELEIEVLETSALADLHHVGQIIAGCRARGVDFSLDDFGTGYSSLTHLKHLQVSWIKIDRSFVSDMLHDANDLAILEGVIGLAAAFRRKVIAEGVENAAQAEALLALGCEHAQGYWIARPMPPQEIPTWLATRTPPEGS